jgi:hypothetical protein
MEIHSLHILLTEQDLNDLAKKHMPKDLPVDDVRLIMKMVDDIARREPWVHVNGDQLIADPDQACAQYAVAGKTHLKSIIVQTGLMVIEAGY